MSLRGKKVLVTGAGGFIGSQLTERLVELGASTRALLHYRGDGSLGWLQQSPLKEEIECVAGDVCDLQSVTHAMKGAEIVFHLAALIAIPYSYQAPGSFVRVNVEGTLNVLLAAREQGIERLIHTSTSEVYGTARYTPIDEAHPLQAQSPYAASKSGADKLVEAFGHSYGVPAVTVRPFNTYGPRQSARAIVPTIITQCLTGSTVRLGNLSPSRDMNFVGDTVEGFVKASQAPAAALGRVFNIGSGREIRIGELARLIAEAADRQVEIVQDGARVRPEGSEVERLLASSAAARDVLGWEPAITLEAGVKTTIEWFKEHLDGYRPGVYAV